MNIQNTKPEEIIMDIGIATERFIDVLKQNAWENIKEEEKGVITAVKISKDRTRRMKFEIRIITNETPDETQETEFGTRTFKREDTQYRGPEITTFSLDEKGKILFFGGTSYNFHDPTDQADLFALLQ